MTEERFLIAQPIRSLQYMLGELSYADSRLPFLAPDGIFGEETLESVMIFQREYGLPVTGRVDQRTWDTISDQFLQWERERALPRPLAAFPPRPFQIEPGEANDTLALTQVMFRSLSQLLDGITPTPPDGHHGPFSVDNTRWLQRHAGLEETGTMDRFTWNMLTRLYALFVTRRCELKNCTNPF